MSVDLNCIRAAHKRIRAYIHHTPVLTSSRLNDGERGVAVFQV